MAADTLHTYHKDYVDRLLTATENDSIFDSSISAIQSVIELVEPQYAIEQLRNTNLYSPVYLFVFIVLSLIIVIKYFYAEYYNIVIPSTISMKAYMQNLHLKKVFPFVPNVLMYSIRILGVAIILNAICSVVCANSNTSMLQILAAVAIFMVAQNVVEYILNTLVLEKEVYVDHFFQKQMVQVIAIILAVPAVIYIVKHTDSFSIYFIYFIGFLFVLQYLILGWRWTLLLKNQRPYQFLYYFIYFCSLKIIPVLVIVRWVYNSVY